jgi:hypothetical protein
MLIGEIISVCSKNNADNMNKMCHKNAEFLGALVKLRKATISFVISVRLSVRPYGTSRLPLDGFSRNLVFNYFSKICR